MPLIAGIAVAALVAIGVIAWLVSAFSGDDASETSAAGGSSETQEITEGLGSADQPIKIGVVGADPYWQTLQDAARDAGINTEIVTFTDYNQPNPALAEGEIDVNQFQHIIFLAQYNVASGENLVPIGSTATYPLGLYSRQFDSVDAIPDGATIAVPK